VKKIFLNRKLFAIHSWLGLWLGIFYFLISVSGALSVFRFELNDWVYGKKMDFTIDPTKHRISYDSIFSIARSKFPGKPYYVCGFDEEYAKRPAFMSAVEHVRPELFSTTMRYKVNYINPYSGKDMLLMTSQGKNNVIDWIMGFHYTFALGEGGELFVVLLDFGLLVSIITGFFFYRKYILKVLLFKVNISFSNWRLASSGLHRTIGVWALIFNLLIFASGLYIQKKFFTEKWWAKYENTLGHQIHHIQYPLSTVSLDSLAVVACKIAPQMHFVEFSIDCGDGGVISAFGTIKESRFLAYDNSVLVNFDSSGKYLATIYQPWKQLSASEKFENINFSAFHTGWAFGKPGKIIWCIMGFTPAMLSLTGFLLYWRKRKSRLKAASKKN